MFLRIIFILVIVITNSVLAAELVSRLERDDTETNTVASAESTSAEDSAESIVVVPDCSLHTSTSETNPLGRLGQIFTAQRRMSLENSAESNLAMSNEFRMDAGRLRNRKPKGRNVQMDLQRNDNGFQLWETLDRIRQVDNRDEGVPVFRIFDTRQTPQTHLVDTTLRLMSIKNSLENLLMKLFPNFHILQRIIEELNHRNGKFTHDD